MRPTGMLEVFRQAREDAKDFGKGVAKGLQRGTRQRPSDGAGAHASLDERR